MQLFLSVSVGVLSEVWEKDREILSIIQKTGTSVCIPVDKASKKRSASSMVFCAEKLRRIVASASFSDSPKESRVWLTRPLLEEHAEPLDI